MFAIQFMDPYLFWIGSAAVLLVCFGFAVYSTKAVEGARKFFGELILLDQFSPSGLRELRSLWIQWTCFFLLLIAALAGPNATDTPTQARAGALQVQLVFDVSPSMGAEDYRSTLPQTNESKQAGAMYQWGTRLDAARFI
ncbi:MAG: hypothetical protein K2X27_23080, partial [Candidatus Obscuribacterales bacterium]|nr:hypothetical protein [Candidatus Obscuribacterales bacterium]